MLPPWVDKVPSPGYLPNPGIKPGSPSSPKQEGLKKKKKGLELLYNKHLILAQSIHFYANFVATKY